MNASAIEQLDPSQRSLNWLTDLFRTTFCGIQMAQRWVDLVLFEKLMDEVFPELVVEIGTWEGGLSLYLRMLTLQRKSPFHTFDILPPRREGNPLWKVLRMEECFTQEDVFGSGSVLRKLLASDRPAVLLLCDGGNKAREVREFALLLRPGEVIGAHDWGNEIGAADVRPLVEAEQLIPFWLPQCEAINSLWRFWVRG